jgi:hypothetical protein
MQKENICRYVSKNLFQVSQDQCDNWTEGKFHPCEIHADERVLH